MSILVKAVSQRRFLVAAFVLLLLAVGLQPVAEAAGDWLRKWPVPIREALRQFDRTSLAGFRFVEDIGAGNAEAADTGEYIEWRFIPVAADLASVGVAYLNVYYYTEDGSGKTLRIPHTPEVCYRQSGHQVAAMGTVDIPTPGFGPARPSIGARYVRMSHPTEVLNKDICVVYLFCVNGEFYDDREKARIHLALPWMRAVYFSKIECTVLVPDPGRLDASLDAARRLLGDALPELVQRHFPRAADIDAAL